MTARVLAFPIPSPRVSLVYQDRVYATDADLSVAMSRYPEDYAWTLGELRRSGEAMRQDGVILRARRG